MTSKEMVQLFQRGVDHAPLKGSLKFGSGADGVIY
jgi:hypothetical protein